MSPPSKPLSSYTACARRNFIRDYILRAVNGRGVVARSHIDDIHEKAVYLAAKLYPED